MEFDDKYKLTWDDYKHLHTSLLFARLVLRKVGVNKEYYDLLQRKLIYAMEEEEEKEYLKLKEEEDEQL
jgi:hypothetical protein